MPISSSERVNLIRNDPLTFLDLVYQHREPVEKPFGNEESFMHRTRHVAELFDRRPEDVVEVGLECAISRSDEVIYHLLCASQVNEGFPDRAENL